MRDLVALPELLRFGFLLRNKSAESSFTAPAMMAFVTGIASLTPRDDRFRPIWTEYLSKLKDIPKNSKCRALLSEACRRVDLPLTLALEIDSVDARSSTPESPISTLSELRIYQHIYGEPGAHPIQQLKIIRSDPTAEISVGAIVQYFERDDWVFLINRVDSLYADSDSWFALHSFLRSDLIDESALHAIRQYVSSYWPKYHWQFSVPDGVKEMRDNVIAFLGLADSPN
jgi:hypothetical protein